jgi:deazaflavin-dependent oxidoreductase (nitroreductase family)
MSDADYEPSTWEMVADHVERYLATDGDDGFEFHGAKCVILTTTGAKSGKRRRSPLVRVRDGDRYLVVASMGGAPKHPSWYLNLLADPAVTIQDRAETHHLTARIATGDEKAELWPKAVAEWPDYEKYQAKTERDIPLVICE